MKLPPRCHWLDARDVPDRNRPSDYTNALHCLYSLRQRGFRIPCNLPPTLASLISHQKTVSWVILCEKTIRTVQYIGPQMRLYCSNGKGEGTRSVVLPISIVVALAGTVNPSATDSFTGSNQAKIIGEKYTIWAWDTRSRWGRRATTANSSLLYRKLKTVVGILSRHHSHSSTLSRNPLNSDIEIGVECNHTKILEGGTMLNTSTIDHNSKD